MAKSCVRCGKNQGFLDKAPITIRGQHHCSNCAEQVIEEGVASVVATTTNSIDGYYVTQYIDIESVEIVIGTGIISEFGGDLADFFGARSTMFEQKLQNAKKLAFRKLRYIASERGANAVIGVDIDYTEFTGNRIGLIANGTLVRIAKLPETGHARSVDPANAR